MEDLENKTKNPLFIRKAFAFQEVMKQLEEVRPATPTSEPECLGDYIESPIVSEKADSPVISKNTSFSLLTPPESDTSFEEIKADEPELSEIFQDTESPPPAPLTTPKKPFSVSKSKIYSIIGIFTLIASFLYPPLISYLIHLAYPITLTLIFNYLIKNRPEETIYSEFKKYQKF